ncbi:MAG TPA: UDP-N-acetylmuramate dehydrogenase [Sandaracinaceae bacterium LLY-WYZ-13_1]|nr:UDP-N-acetylmuramate dehydrogenase [Sandaracinaceae bacterium LLY-WYZ-13_1]
MIPAVDILEDVPLAPHTTLELGGDARFFLRATDERTVRDALRWAARRGVRVGILGGGSNLVVDDAGFDGLVVEMALRGVEEREEGDRVLVTAAAGEEWDPFVERTVAAGWQGLECLGGIPGRVGATPIQNVGAYGQEVAETITSVRVLDRDTLAFGSLAPQECAFAYRDSYFKRNPERYVVLAVTFALRPDAPPAVRYAELARALEDVEAPSSSTVRETVIALRRRKSMVLDFADENHRSAGSFFTNPVMSADEARRVVDRAVADGLVERAEDVPRWDVGDDRVKLAAGWLVERAGMHKGTRHGRVGISTKHALALVHHGGGTTEELLELAARVEAAVRDRFGVTLQIEPTRW